MNRRGFLARLLGAGSAMALDPERALWVPGKRVISIPKPMRVSVRFIRAFDLRYGEIIESLDASHGFDLAMIDGVETCYRVIAPTIREALAAMPPSFLLGGIHGPSLSLSSAFQKYTACLKPMPGDINTVAAGIPESGWSSHRYKL